MRRLNLLIFDTRSGSTFLASLLEKFPELGVTLESPLPFILLTGKSMYSTVNDVDILFEELYGKKRKIYADETFSEWGIDRSFLREKVLSKLPISNKDLMLLILDIYFKQTKPTAEFYIYKGVDLYLLKRVKNVFPDSKCIYIYRDGRAVYASKKRAVNLNTGEKMANDPIAEARRWVRNFNLVEKAYGNKNILYVKYEQLVERKEDVLQAIRSFVTGNNSSLISHPEGRGNTYLEKIPAMQKQLHPNVGKSPIRSRINAWRGELSLPELYFYEKASYKVLKKWEYKPVSYDKTQNLTQKLRIYGYLAVLAWLRLKNLVIRLKLYCRDPKMFIKRMSLRLGKEG